MLFINSWKRCLKKSKLQKHSQKTFQKVTEEDEKNFKQAKECHICGKTYTESKKSLSYHRKYRGSAHQDCNTNYFRLNFEDVKIPVIFHNLRGYGVIANKYT